MKERISIIRVMKYAGAYIAFEIGSGFATGQEILQFYTSYGTMGIAGAIVSMILFSWAGGSLMKIGHLEVDNMQEYVRYSISFESAFITCCDNPYITRQYGQIEDLFYMIVLYNHWHIDRSRNHTVMEHQQILSAIISGDYSTAKDLLSAHYNRFQLNETN